MWNLKLFINLLLKTYMTQFFLSFNMKQDLDVGDSLECMMCQVFLC